MQKSRLKLFKFLWNFSLFALFICMCGVLSYSYFDTKILTKKEFDQKKFSVIHSLSLGIDKKTNNKNPRNLFINFSLKAPTLLRNNYKNYYDIVKCISENKPQEGYAQFIDVKKLYIAILETTFKLTDIMCDFS
jgi:hypothetical protein